MQAASKFRGHLVAAVAILAIGLIAQPQYGRAGELTGTAPTQAGPKAKDGEPSILSAGGVTFKFVRIPAGESLMGSEKGRPDEKPIHRVRIPKNLEITRTEVTVGQFRAFIEATGYRTRAEIDGGSNICNDKGEWPFVSGAGWRQPGYEQSDDCPVVCVNWHDATAFCAWLSRETAEQCRLPAEAEWEYACRAGDVREDQEWLSLMAWYGPNAGGRPHPVARKKPNAWGLYDMHGNVSEWCLDVYHKSYADAPDDGSAWVTKGDDYGYYPGENRVVRGATWITGDPGKLRPAFRRALRPTVHDNLIGFRVVRVRLKADANGL